MAEITTDKFATSDFVPERFVKELVKTCVGGEELLLQKEKIKTLAEETSVALKKNVYQNHMQFIETATEISHLEAEMYKLSHLLSEQRSVLNTLSNTSVLGNDNSLSPETDGKDFEAERMEEQRKNKLNSISEKVENCPNLFDVSDRVLLHEGDMLEIDAEENTALQRMHAYLFSDCFMLAMWITNRRGPMRYRYQSMYPIGTLAVVNVRDLGNVKQAFKLLAFPDTRVFQCNSFNSKKDWLEKFDLAKKAYLQKEQARLSKKDSVDKPRQESLDSPTYLSSLTGSNSQMIELPEWLSDVSEELDVLIVERHFQQAYELMTNARKALDSTDYKDHPKKSEILNKIDFKQKSLIEMLLKELDVTHDWSPRGGLRSVRHAVSILNRFNMTSQACDLFLAICSHTLKIHNKAVQLEGSTTSYVNQVGEVFFCTLSDALTEFTVLFPKNKISAFVLWASTELRILLSQIIKQIFTPQSSLQLILECVESLRDQCTLFCEFGLDLRFQLNSSLRAPITKAIKEYQEKTVDSMKPKLLEDKWTPVNMHTKGGVNKFLGQMQSLGLILAKYVINETWVDLSSSTIWFVQSVMTVQKIGLKLVTKDMLEDLDNCIYAIFNSRLMLSIGNDSNYAQKNFKFILDTVLPFMLKNYKEEVGYENEKLTVLAKKFGVNVGPPKRTANITKYTSNEYL